MKVIRPTELETDGFKIGDKIEVPLTPHTFTATCQEVKCGKALFFFDDCVGEGPMNKKRTNGGFEKSLLKAWLNRRLQPALYGIFGDRLVDDVTIPTVEQVFGPMEGYEALGGEQLPLQKIRQNRICSDPNGGLCWYWLKNTYGVSYFADVYNDGDCYAGTATNSGGIRPAFTLTDL